MRRLEVAAQPPGATLDSVAASMLGELLEEVLDQVLLGETLEHLDLLDRDGRLIGDRAREIELAGSLGDERTDQLVSGDERHRHARGPATPAHFRPELAESDRRGLVAPRRLGKAAKQPVLLGVAEIEAHSLGAEQLPRPPHELRSEHVERLGRGNRLGELGELLELAHALPRLVVELRVLDRTRDERRARDEEVHFRVGELARRDGVESDRADRLAALAVERHRNERLKPLFLELGHVFHTRIVEGVLAYERRLALGERPPCKTLAALQLDAAREVRVRRGSGAQHEPLPVTIEEVDEAGVRSARVGEQANDPFEDLLEVERGPDRRDDLLEEAFVDCSRHVLRDDRSIVTGRAARMEEGVGGFDESAVRRSSCESAPSPYVEVPSVKSSVAAAFSTPYAATAGRLPVETRRTPTDASSLTRGPPRNAKTFTGMPTASTTALICSRSLSPGAYTTSAPAAL